MMSSFNSSTFAYLRHKCFCKLVILGLLCQLVTSCASTPAYEKQLRCPNHKSAIYYATRYIWNGLSEDHIPGILKGLLALALPAAAIGETIVLPLSFWEELTYQADCLGWQEDPSKVCQEWQSQRLKQPSSEKGSAKETKVDAPVCTVEQLSDGPPLQLKDSGLFTDANPDIVWWDNAHVLFRGFTEAVRDPKSGAFQYRDSAYYSWDSQSSVVSKVPQLSTHFYSTNFNQVDTWNICVSGDYWSYLRGTSRRKAIVVSGLKGQETERPWSELTMAYNPRSCRYSEGNPYGIMNGRRVIPLLEEHGYIDLGEASGGGGVKDRKPVYFREGVAEGLPLKVDLRWEMVSQYAPFVDGYIIKQGTGGVVFQSIWVLHPNGTVEPKLTQDGAPWKLFGWLSSSLTKQGVFLTSHFSTSTSPGKAGGYFFRGENPVKLFDGEILNETVSPDGCNIVFIRRTAISEGWRVQMIDVCQGLAN